MTKEKYEYDFKGGNNLEGIYEDYHHIMMMNELKGGKGGYELKWAENESGPSFGGNQMDMSKNEYSRQIFKDIMENATDANGNKILSSSQISKIDKVLDNEKAMVGASHHKLFGNMVSTIDLALQSPYGKKAIHQAYVNEMLTRGNWVESFVDALNEGPGKNFAKTDIGKMCVFDFYNQYGIKKRGALHTFLNGGKATLKSGKVLGPITKQDFNIEDFKKDFLFHLKRYKDNPDDVIRRLNNIEQYIKSCKDKPASDNKGVKVSMCDCAEFFNVSKRCAVNPMAIMVLGTKMQACRNAIEWASDQHRGKNAYSICKELYGMDFDAYSKYVPQNI